MFDITDNNGFQMTFANGITISVKWGRYSYSDNQDINKLWGQPVPASKTAEVAAWTADNRPLIFPNGDEIAAYQTADQVAALIADLIKEPAIPKPKKDIAFLLKIDGTTIAGLKMTSNPGDIDCITGEGRPTSLRAYNLLRLAREAGSKKTYELCFENGAKIEADYVVHSLTLLDDADLIVVVLIQP